MKNLLFSVSGLRGIVGDGLNPLNTVRYTAAFASWNGKGLYLLGSDTRPHGDVFVDLVKATLRALGNDVVDLGIVPTPTLLYLVRKWEAQGGVIVTASHNPIEWNALKFVKKGGIFPSDREKEDIEKGLDGPFKWARWDEVGGFLEDFTAWTEHVDDILTSPYVDVDSIKSKNFKVAVDAVNGAAHEALPALLEELGTGVVRLNCSPESPFPHKPEPRPDALVELDALLKAGSVDIGFAVDPDGDRLLLGITGRGLLSEEYTVPLAVYSVLMRKKGDVVVNYSSSLLTDRIASKFGVKVYRARVGEANVVEKMREVGALIGGEGNGGVIFPEINSARDSLVGAALILSLFSKRGFEVIDELPQYHLIKKSFPVKEKFQAQRLAAYFENGQVSLEDGLYVRYENSWVHIRPSNTEPIIRVFAEAESSEDAENLVKNAEDVLKRAGLL